MFQARAVTGATDGIAFNLGLNSTEATATSSGNFRLLIPYSADVVKLTYRDTLDQNRSIAVKSVANKSDATGAFTGTNVVAQSVLAASTDAETSYDILTAGGSITKYSVICVTHTPGSASASEIDAILVLKLTVDK
jgi:hypothetical protein